MIPPIWPGGKRLEVVSAGHLRGRDGPPRAVTSRPPRGKFRNVSGRRRSSRLSRSLYVTLLQFLRPHHVLRPRDRYRTITPLPLVGILPEPVHATRSDAETSTIMHLARIPGKELPQDVPFNPVPVCPPAALADLHDAHSHPGFVRRQHSAHVEILPFHGTPSYFKQYMRYFEVPSRIVHLAFSPSATMRLAWGHAGSVRSSLTMPV